MRKLTLLVVLILLTGLGWATWRGLDFLFIPPSTEVENQQFVNFDVAPRMSFQSVSQSLHKKDLIKDPFLFKVLAKVLGATGKIQVGEYALRKSMTPMQILDVLSSGKSIQYSLTFQEGINMYEIAQAIQDRKLGNKEEFLALCRDKKFIKELLGQGHETLEGYLFPETYMVTKFTGPKKANSSNGEKL